MPKTTCNLYDCFLCQHCMIEWRPLIGLNKDTRMIKKGKAVFRESDPVEGIYFLYRGWVKIHKEWTHPKELVVRFAGSGDIIGHRGLGEKKTTRFPQRRSKIRLFVLFRKSFWRPVYAQTQPWRTD